MRMQRTACRGEVLYQIYLDLWKAYDSIHREAVLALLEKYGVGPNIIRYIRNIWEDQEFFCKQGGFFSLGIKVERGATQGGVDSPIIFNLIIDAVIWKVKEDMDFGRSVMLFYADDGLIENSDETALQRDVDAMVNLFAKFGLKANREKTKFMVVRGPQAPLKQSLEMYNNIQKGKKKQNNWRKDVVW